MIYGILYHFALQVNLQIKITQAVLILDRSLHSLIHPHDANQLPYTNLSTALRGNMLPTEPTRVLIFTWQSVSLLSWIQKPLSHQRLTPWYLRQQASSCQACPFVHIHHLPSECM